MKTQAKKTRRSILDVRRSAAPGKVLDSTASISMVSAARQIFPLVQIPKPNPFRKEIQKQKHQKLKRLGINEYPPNLT